MILSQKLNALREDVNAEMGFTIELADGFNRCIEDAQWMENRLHEIKTRYKKLYSEVLTNDPDYSLTESGKEIEKFLNQK